MQKTELKKNNMYYKEFLPSKHLAEIVQDYWVFEVLENKNLNFPIKHETLPESNVSIVLIQQPYFNGIRILGPRNKKYHQPVFPNSIYFGIRLNPWLTLNPKLFSKREIINETIEASDLITKHINLDNNIKKYLLSLPLLEKKLTHLFNKVEIEQDDLVKFICVELSHGTPIHLILNKIPFSVRVVQKRFKSIVGLSMRQFASNLKQRKLWEDLLENNKNKIDVIYKHNYYDQSHFINEFKRKMKRSVSDYETYLKKIEISLA